MRLEPAEPVSSGDAPRHSVMSETAAFRRASDLFKEACAVEPSRRAAFLRDRCQQDNTLFQRVQAMLERDAAPHEPLLADGGARLLADELAAPSGSAVT